MDTQDLPFAANDKGTAVTHWTQERVQKRLEEAASVLARLPAAKVEAYLGLLPGNSLGKQRKNSWGLYVNLHGIPKAQEIARMEEALVWFHWLAPEERRLVWMRATRMNWKLVCCYIRYSRTEAWRRWASAIGTIVSMLDQTSDQAPLFGQVAGG